MAWSLAMLPLVAGLLLWWSGCRIGHPSPRAVLGIAAVAVLVGDLALAIVAVSTSPSDPVTYDVGSGLVLVADLAAPANVVVLLVPAIGATVAAWAAAHEELVDLERLLGLLTAFVGAMQLLVIAGDLLTLIVGFELVGALSWALIGHAWRDPAAPSAGAHAFNATRFGGLGLFVAAGATWSATGSIAFDGLDALSGMGLHAAVAGILLAAAAKSAQGPFAPWLFSAMAGPTSVSALLHSSTMVAAGVYILARLHPFLDGVGWFAPVTIGLGLSTALTGGVVALLQSHAKKLLAASTSAQYGLMLVAVGAGYPAVAVVHLVVHAVFKAELFLAAGVAMHAVGSSRLGRMRLGRRLPTIAWFTLAGTLALAAVPPLGGAWSKEAVVAAAGHRAPWVAVAVIAAGALSAAYATRFHLLAFGRNPAGRSGPRDLAHLPSRTEEAAIGLLAAASVLLGALWLPIARRRTEALLDGPLAQGPTWELVLSLLAVGVAIYVVVQYDLQGRLGHVGLHGRQAAWADWLGLPMLIGRTVVDPSLALAAALARFDARVLGGGVVAAGGLAHRLAVGADRRLEPLAEDLPGAVASGGRWLTQATTRALERGVDATVAGTAWVVERAGADARRTHTGMVHHQFVVIVVGLGVIAVAAFLGS